MAGRNACQTLRTICLKNSCDTINMGKLSQWSKDIRKILAMQATVVLASILVFNLVFVNGIIDLLLNHIDCNSELS